MESAFWMFSLSGFQILDSDRLAVQVYLLLQVFCVLMNVMIIPTRLFVIRRFDTQYAVLSGPHKCSTTAIQEKILVLQLYCSCNTTTIQLQYKNVLYYTCTELYYTCTDRFIGTDS